RDRGPGPRRPQGPRLHGLPAGGRGQREPAAHGDPAPRAAQGLEGDPRPGREGHHLRHRRHQPQARRPHVGDEGGPGGGGGAAVPYTMRALGRLAPDVKVVGILCCAENFPDANAQRPGDIFTAKNGKSIVVDNTDAEGRLVLTDGLHRAGEEGATHVIDIATLTGACLRALGPSVAGVLGTDRELIRRVIRSGENHGEAFWELPLVEEYRDALKTPYADINNIASGGLAGAITASL